VPLVVVIEDLHWADSSSLELLELLFNLVESQPILFINIFRPDYEKTSKKVRHTLKGKQSIYHIEIELEPLDANNSETLISNMLNIEGMSYIVKKNIIKRTGGNPFFIEEVVRSFVDEGAIVKKEGRFEVTNKIDTVDIPYTVNDVLAARIDRLEDETRQLVKNASVIGRNFFRKILIEVSRTVSGIDDRLNYLKDIQFIRDRRRWDEIEYLFKHALAQEAAYGSILHEKRKKLHFDVAKAIERAFSGRLHEFYGVLALHYTRAEEWAQAEHYLSMAGEEALRSSASNEALIYYQEGLRLYLKYGLDREDSEKLSMFQRNIALAFFNKGQWAEAVNYFDKVLERYGAPLPKMGPTVIIKLIWDLFVMLNVINWRLPYFRKLPGGKDEAILEIYHKEGMALQFIDPARQFMCISAIFRYTLKFDLSKIPKLANYWSAISAVLSGSGLSFGLSNKVVSVAKRYKVENNIESQMTYACISYFNHTCQGAWGEFKNLSEDLLDASLSNGDFFNVAGLLWSYGLVNSEKGECEHVNKTIDKLYEIAKVYDWDQANSYALEIKADFLVKTRQASEVILESDNWLSHTREKGDKFHEMLLTAFKAEAQQLAGDTAGARSSILKAEKIYEAQSSVTLSCFIAPYSAARLFIDIEQLKNAILSNSSLDIVQLKKRANAAGKVAIRRSRKYAPYRTKVLRLMGQYCWLIGKQGKALKWWRRAIKEGRLLNARPDLARTYFEVGKQLITPHSKFKQLDGKNPMEYLNEARNLFEEMELKWDLDELNRFSYEVLDERPKQ